MSGAKGRFAILGLLAAFFGPFTANGADMPGPPLQVISTEARDAIARVAYAEAGNQGDSGLAGVVFTVLNRLSKGSWGSSLEAVLNTPGQFEPVMRAGGDWRRLPEPSATQRAHIDAILNLALDGRLPDLTNGALYFQNPAIVARRAAAGQVSAHLIGFGGATPIAVIGDHAFYDKPRGRGGEAWRSSTRTPQSLFVGQPAPVFRGSDSGGLSGPSGHQSNSVFIDRVGVSAEP